MSILDYFLSYLTVKQLIDCLMINKKWIVHLHFVNLLFVNCKQ